MDFRAFIGVDISKLTLDVVILIPEKQSIQHRKVDNNEEGFSEILAWIKKKDSGMLEDAVFCMEHTGVYGKPLCNFLAKNQLNFALQTPLHIKQSMGIRRTKNDKADAELLARFAYLHREELKLSSIPSKILRKLRELLVYRERLVKARVSLIVGIKDFSLFNDKEIQLTIVRNNEQNVNQLTKSIEIIERDIQATIRSASEIRQVYNLVTSVPGIGLIVAANLIVFTNGFTSFESWRKFACYCGIAPFEHTSGTSIKGKPKISKIGNRKLKVLLSLAAISAVNYDNELRAYYTRKLNEGKEKPVVLNTIKNKLINRVFATIKRGTPYVKISQPELVV